MNAMRIFMKGIYLEGVITYVTISRDFNLSESPSLGICIIGYFLLASSEEVRDVLTRVLIKAGCVIRVSIDVGLS